MGDFMKKRLKIFSVILAFVLCITTFTGCNNSKLLKKVSKNLTTYAIDATFDDQNMTVKANEIVNVKNSTDVSLIFLCFNLYGRAFREEAIIKPYTKYNEGKCFPNGVTYGDMIINSVKVSGQDSEFEIVGDDDNALKVNLKEELEPGEFIKIEINFDLILAECTHRLGFINHSVNLGNWYPILAIYEKGEFVIEPYYSTGDPFYSDIANYEVDFSFADKYSIASSGNILSESSVDGIKSVKLKSLAMRDFAITLTEDCRKVTKNFDNIAVTYSAYDGDTNIDYCLDVSIKALKYFNETFGSYPYEKLEVVKAPFVHGGMEYPGLVIISDSINKDFDVAKVIVHEIAHQWWYGVVGNNEIKEAWLDESLAEYSTVMFFENHSEFGVTYEEQISDAFSNYVLYADIVSVAEQKLNTSMLLPVNEYAGDYEYSYMIYVKGVLMFDNLRGFIGKEKIEKSLKKYYSKFKFKIATTDELIVLIKKTSGKDIEGIMDSWLNGKTVVGTI